MEDSLVTDSPQIRAFSPSPSSSPTPGLRACPPLERSVSTASSASAFSAPSSTSRSSDAGKLNRRGYLRPQGTNFASSARNRESVMNLGSIAHLQYYFARTGLLEGKGGQLFTGKTKEKTAPSHGGPSSADDSTLSLKSLSLDGQDSTYSSMGSSPDSIYVNDHGLHPSGVLTESPTGEDDETQSWEKADAEEPVMLPPTVSTYNYRTRHIPPPPKIDELRKQLRDSIREASVLMKDLEKDAEANSAEPENLSEQTDVGDSFLGGQSSDGAACTANANHHSPPTSPKTQGWFEIQGMNVLDVMTLAIRAAKLYYTAHEQPARLYEIKPERKIREELLTVMDALKKMAMRNFAGGTRPDERQALQSWVRGVEDLLGEEALRLKLEAEERETWKWMHDDWTGREREREWLFLRCFDPTPDSLPNWTCPKESTSSGLPTDFLKTMQNGLRLIQLHNQMVRKSKKVFELITVFHTDTQKPYRCADNLRFWIKAAELRWEIILKVDVMGVVYGQSEAAWKGFDQAILRWCEKVRGEIAIEAQEERSSNWV
ncbi:MAG: hypothetical protein M1837_003490 [Sclerophora amabilis]|nr:MAG: hypothetical protein M1837_003490 [Sclerophora amabilis]